MNVRWHGRVLVIAGAHPAPADLMAQLPAEPDRHTVLVVADPPPDPGDLAALLAEHLPTDATSVRLALSHASGLGQRLADELRLEVVAPDGVVLLLPGMLFVLNSEGDGHWLAYRPESTPTPLGPRHPAPGWELSLPRPSRFARRDIVARSVPCGIWLHGEDSMWPDGTDPAYAVPAEQHRMTVLIGHPSGAQLPADAVYRYLAALPQHTRELLTLTPYGPHRHVVELAAGRLAATNPIEVAGGLPIAAADGTTRRVEVDSAGLSSRLRLAQRVDYQATGCRVLEWINPFTARSASGVAEWQLDDQWTLELVSWGLWLRTAEQAGDDATRRRPAEPDGDLLAASVPPPLLDSAERAAQRVLASLAEQVRAGLTVVISSDGSVATEQVTAATAEPVVQPVIDVPTTARPAADSLAPPVIQPPPPPALVPVVSPVTQPPPAPVPPPAPAVKPPAPPPAPPPSPQQKAPVLPPGSAPQPTTGPPPALRAAQQAVTPMPAPATTAPPVTVVGPAAGTPPALTPAPARPAAPSLPATPALSPVLAPDAGLFTTDPARVTARRSTPAEQRAARERLGGAYDIHARTVAEMLIHHPGLRSGGGESPDAATVDLATVTVFLADTPDWSGPGREALMACLVSGVLRLPVYFGPVLVDCPETPESWQPGQLVSTTGVLRGRRADMPGQDGPQAALTVRSLTGRQVGALSAGGQVLFAPGTSFEVLRVEDADGRRRALLREVVDGLTGAGSLGPNDDLIRTWVTTLRE